jgi:hypothetical protein
VHLRYYHLDPLASSRPYQRLSMVVHAILSNLASWL